MNVPDPANPDDLIKTILSWIFGPNSIIVVIFVLINFGFAWYRAAQSAHQRARQAYDRISSMRPTGATAVIGTSTVMVLAQTAYLVASYVIAVELSVALGLQEGVQLYDYANWAKVPTHAHWDTFSAWYLGISALVVVISCYCAAKGRSASFLLWISAPGWLAAALIVFAGCSAIVLHAEGSDPQYTTHLVWSYPIVLVALLGYIALFIFTVNMPKRFFRAWRESVTPA